MTTTTRGELPTRYDAAAVEPGDLRALAGERCLLARGGAAARRRALRDHHAAAERHRRAAQRACGVRDARGPADPLPPHARRRHALAARGRPRQHRRAVRARQDHRRGGGDARLARSRALPGAHVAVHGRDARRHRPARCVAWAPAPTGRGSASRWMPAAPGRCGSPSSGCGTPTSSTAARRSSTGARAAAPPSATSRTCKHEETGTLWTIRYHLAREDGTPDPDAWITVATTRPETMLRRHGGGGASRGRSLPGARRPRGDPALPRPAPADHRRRARGA